MMTGMERLDQSSARAMRTLLELQPVTLAKVTFAWTIAAGPALARRARVSWPGNGALRLTAASEAWRREIVRAKPMVADRLAQLLGTGVVRTIVIDIDAKDADGTSRKPHA
jgi:hypothetical protein